MTRVFRTDRTQPGALQRLDNGFVRFQMSVARSGILVYKLDDGSEWREYRPPEEAFKATSMRTLANIPMTNDHPPVLLNAENAKQYTVGYTGDRVDKRADYIEADGTLFDAQTIADMDAGKREISAGYELDLDFTPGSVNGERYDAIQRAIDYNHVALVDKGRAGGAKVKMDAAGVISEKSYRFDSFIDEATLKQRKGSKPMEKDISVNGVTYKVSAECEAALLKKFRGDADIIEDLKKQVETAKAETTKAVARADASDADKSTAEKALEEAKKKATDETAIQARVDARSSLLVVAMRLVGKNDKGERIDYSKTSDRDIKIALIKKFDSKFDATGKDDTYIQARVDHVLATHGDADESNSEEEENNDDDEEEEGEGGANKDSDDEQKRLAANRANNGGKKKTKTPEELRADNMRKDSEAWKKPAPGAYTRDQLRR